jgi:hypothetical protein
LAPLPGNEDNTAIAVGAYRDTTTMPAMSPLCHQRRQCFAPPPTSAMSFRCGTDRREVEHEVRPYGIDSGSGMICIVFAA